jgi:hypothetical protein
MKKEFLRILCFPGGYAQEVANWVISKEYKPVIDFCGLREFPMLIELVWRKPELRKPFWWLAYKVDYLVKYLRCRGAVMTILFYPDRPALYSTLSQLCHLEGVRISTNPTRRYDASIFWKDSTFCELDHTARNIAGRTSMINSKCLDISKQRVDVSHQRALGYGMKLDPTVQDGAYLRKSNKNYAHDGLIMERQLTPEEYAAASKEDFLFVKLINNAVSIPTDALPGPDSDYVQEFRVPYFDGTIPVCYIKYRPIAKRFTSYNTVVTLAQPNEVFSREECAQIVEFCRDLGFDCGELDVLRDTDDGKIYIVDANTTPWGPPRNTNAADALMSFKQCGAALVDMCRKRS